MTQRKQIFVVHDEKHLRWNQSLQLQKDGFDYLAVMLQCVLSAASLLPELSCARRKLGGETNP